MSRRTPNCAYCGKPLKDTDCYLRYFPSLAGKPEVGWHAFGADSCVDRDELVQAFPARNAITLVQQLQAIESRGPGRLVANKEWQRLPRGSSDART